MLHSFSILIITTLFALATGTLRAELDEKEVNTLKLQIFLNEHNFGPGFLDAKAGHFSMLAIQNYNLKNGRDETDFRYVQEAQTQISDALVMAVVPSFSNKFVDPTLSTKRLTQSQRKNMPYRSVAEFIAERYHTSIQFLTKINGAEKMSTLKPRQSLLVPNVDPFLIEALKNGKTFHPDPKLKDRYIIIDTSINQLKIYQKQFLVPAVLAPSVEPLVESLEDLQLSIENSNKPPAPIRMVPDNLSDEEIFSQLQATDIIASFPITPGKPQFIRRGYWKVKVSIELPIWRYDKSLLETGKIGKESMIIPGGPNNPVGVMWHGLTRQGIGIHGTSSPETIGRSQSAGCIRLANWDVVKLPHLIRPGTKVWLK